MKVEVEEFEVSQLPRPDPIGAWFSVFGANFLWENTFDTIKLN